MKYLSSNKAIDMRLLEGFVFICLKLKEMWFNIYNNWLTKNIKYYISVNFDIKPISKASLIFLFGSKID